MNRLFELTLAVLYRFIPVLVGTLTKTEDNEYEISESCSYFKVPHISLLIRYILNLKFNTKFIIKMNSVIMEDEQ